MSYRVEVADTVWSLRIHRIIMLIIQMIYINVNANFTPAPKKKLLGSIKRKNHPENYQEENYQFDPLAQRR